MQTASNSRKNIKTLLLLFYWVLFSWFPSTKISYPPFLIRSNLESPFLFEQFNFCLEVHNVGLVFTFFFLFVLIYLSLYCFDDVWFFLFWQTFKSYFFLLFVILPVEVNLLCILHKWTPEKWSSLLDINVVLEKSLHPNKAWL